ncbi:MAG: hypothetical protein V1717_04485 [Candidatus Micrarchaeota archaeon]
MVWLEGWEILAQEITLVLSAIVLVFWVSYSLVIYNQMKSGTVRRDWWLSMVFYVGIAMLVLGNLLLAYSKLNGTEFGEQVSLAVNLLSMLIFIFAFYLRMEHALKLAITNDFRKPSGRKRRARR